MAQYLVITGGSGGIGEATIKHFTSAGWEIINISLDSSSLSHVVNICVDFSNPSNINTISKQLSEALIDASKICLIHAAGYQIKDTADTIQLEGLMTTLNVNVVCSALLNNVVIPLMGPGSSIIYISSMLGERGVPGNASYIVSKHAVIGLMRATCQDLIGRDISTCCICPGLVETKFLRDSMSDEMIAGLLNTYVIGKRVIEPKEIAKIIHDCATSPAINGAIVPANLGLFASS